MKAVQLIARVLLGLVFLVFGMNGFLHFIRMPPVEGLAFEFRHALVESHYMDVIMGLQVLGGLLMLTSRFVPLALTLLGPVIVNILLFHMTMDPKGLPLAIVVAALWAVVYWGERHAFAGILAPGPSPLQVDTGATATVGSGRLRHHPSS